MAAAYDPGAVEGRISQAWEASGAFAAPDPRGRTRFSVVMPPPNVTGRLHMGHALDCTLQDVFVRWHRLRGDATLWLPGTDHAGIATQAVVERRLREEGTSRAALGREEFLRRTWAWKDEYEAGIAAQLRRLGCSCDFTRQRFTLEPALAAAVEEVFLRYHRDGLIYRGERIVNWCPGCGTAISDIEVEHEDEPGLLYRVRYPLEGGGEIVIATVRPETMLGDTAVAVNPADGRHAALVGRRAILPLVGRHIPIVADSHVLPEFGTGALKVTPAHDADDFAIAARHGLPAVAVIGTDGRMTAEAGPYAGLDRFEARRRVAADLEAGGYLVGTDPYTVPLGRCERCDSVIEPLISLQWFVRVRPLVEPVLAALRAGEPRLVPERFTRLLEQALENEHDWCISRQLWWGHRIPAYLCGRCGEATVSAEQPAACAYCGEPGPARDPDVLDTWFSSALWPFSTLGWPQATADLAGYYPTDLLVTGYDILFKWVMKMAWSGLRFTGRMPFRTVLLHGLVRDGEGRKMSKSLGNGVDPLEIIERWGADALRLTLLVGVAPGNDTRFLPEKLEGSQRFCNKLWNAARFVLAAPDDGTPPGPRELPDRYIRSRLEAVRAEAEQALERLDAGEALAGLQAFVWDDFCDWYVEATKRRLYGRAGAASRAAAREALREVLGSVLRLLHPFLPFITEELWAQLGEPGLLAGARWPQPRPGDRDQDAEAAFGLCRAAVSAIRSLRAELRIPPGAAPPALAHGPGAGTLAEERETVCALARLGSLELRAPRPGEPGASAVVGAGLELYLPLEGVIDLPAEAARLRRELEGVRREQDRTAARLENPDFRTRAKPEVVAREEARQAELVGAVRRLEERIASLSGRQEGPGQKWNAAP